MRILLYISCFLFFSYSGAKAQELPLKNPRNTLSDERIDSIPKPLGSESLNINDTINIPNNIKYAQEPIESEIDYFAEDSMLFDVVQNKIYLYGNASVKYESFELKAGQIIFDKNNNLVIAEGMQDSLGNITGIPEFKDEEQEFKAKKIKYNFKTEKGLITEVTTQQNDLYIHSGTLKYQKSHDHEGHHHAEDVIYSKNSIFTTCDHPEPHFGIRSQKQKVIANKMIVVGPSNLEIAGVSTPLWIPFGFFPMTKGKRSGLIIPKDFETSPLWGVGFKNFGYYWALNDKLDFQVTSDLYVRGTWRVYTKMRYKVKYKFNGSLDVQYGWNYRREIPGEIGRGIDKTLIVGWVYNQDRAANPNYTFKSNVNFQINNAESVNNNDYNSVYNNSTSSRIDFGKSFANNTMRLDASINHNQVKTTRQFKVDLPNIRFRVNRFSPFKRKIKTGKKKWYEEIGLTYSADAIARVDTKDTLLFTNQVFDDIKYGIRQKADVNASFRVFKHFNLVPTVNYAESWFPESIRKAYNTTEIITIDTIIDPETQEIVSIDTSFTNVSKLDTTYINGFQPLRTLNANISLNTEVFSTLLFKKGRLEGIRYTIRPNIGFSYTPDYTQTGWGYSDTYEQNDNIRNYSRFEGNVFNQNPSSAGLQMNLTYGFTNILEGKWKTKKDSTKQSKIIKLFDNLSFNGSYNFAADSLKFNPITGRTTLKFFKNITTVTLSAAFSPYILNEEGRTINQTRWETEKRLLRFDFLNTNTRTTINWRQIQKWLGLGDKKSSEKDNERPSRNSNSPRAGAGLQTNDASKNNYGTSFFSDINLSYNFNLRTNKDGTKITTNSLKIRGTINLSKKWHFILSNIGYDFRSKALIYPSMSVVRDLHCWEMAFSWQPQRGTYSFSLYVKPGSLDFINVPWQKNQYDANFGGQF